MNLVLDAVEQERGVNRQKQPQQQEGGRRGLSFAPAPTTLESHRSLDMDYPVIQLFLLSALP